MKTTRKIQRVIRSGFTLIELLIVLGIILAIAAMVVPNLLGQQEEANIKQTRINIKNLESMLKLYAAGHNGEYPADVSMLMQGEVIDGQQRQPITDEIPKDAWGNPLFYEAPGVQSKSSVLIGPAIWSGGVNRVNDDGGNDDINNWSSKEQL